MEKTYIFEGRTTNEAIEKGLKELKVSKSMVDIKVLELEEKRSFFSILTPRVVKVEMKLKDNYKKSEQGIKNNENRKKISYNLEDVKKMVEDFLKEFIEKLPCKNLEYSAKIVDDGILINIDGEEAGFLIGYRGEVMNSIQTVITNIINKNLKERVRIMLNIAGYREKRKKELENLALRLAATVIKTERKIVLEPMMAYERKIIHAKLQENDKIKTYSIGEEPNRKVVVTLNK
ncbi:MAG: Jag N-terminal domain-containing protein [Clostridia bacterium]|nr:Jag N-terminal domain-containing protein [Clostridia bacterium]